MIIETERLVLREVCAEDLAAMLAWNKRPGAQDYLLKGQGAEASIRMWVANTVKAADTSPRFFYGLAITLKPHLATIGVCSIGIKKAAPNIASLGWDLDLQCRGHGYATEAARALVDFAFQSTEVDIIFSECFAANRASIRVMEKLGMRREPLGWLSEWLLGIQHLETRPIARHILPRGAWAEYSGYSGPPQLDGIQH